MNLNVLIAKFREHPVILVCAVLSIGLAAAIFVRGGTLADVRRDLDRVSAEGERIDENIKNSSNLSRHLDSLRSITQDVDTRLIRPSELARNLQYFYRLESETGVRIASLDQRGVPAAGDNEDERVYVSVPYEMSVEGEFRDIISFIHTIENGVHFVRIRNFEIIRARQTESTLLSLAIRLELLGRP